MNHLRRIADKTVSFEAGYRTRVDIEQAVASHLLVDKSCERDLQDVS